MHRSMGGKLHHSMELAAMRVTPDAGGTIVSGFGKELIRAIALTTSDNPGRQDAGPFGHTYRHRAAAM
jgi:hypothetical protein